MGSRHEAEAVGATVLRLCPEAQFGPGAHRSDEAGARGWLSYYSAVVVPEGSVWPGAHSSDWRCQGDLGPGYWMRSRHEVKAVLGGTVTSMAALDNSQLFPWMACRMGSDRDSDSDC